MLKKASRLTKAEAGHFAKAEVEAGRGLWEFRLNDGEGADLKVGSELKVDIFADVKKQTLLVSLKVKALPVGVVKRWNFRTQDMTHGNSRSHRVPGSIGQTSLRVKCSKAKMAGIWVVNV